MPGYDDVNFRVVIIRAIPMPRKISATTTKPIPRHRANSGPTDDTFLQCGHLARALLSVLKMKVSWQ